MNTPDTSTVTPHLLVVGDPFFLSRHKQLIDSLAHYCGTVDILPISERAISRKLFYFLCALLMGRLWPPNRAKLRDCLRRFRMEPSTFARLSRQTARKIRGLPRQPSFVLQMFSMSSPVSGKKSLPYAHYLDLSMARAKREWPPWAPFESDRHYEQWTALEGGSYRGADFIFTFSEATRESIITDYCVDPDRIVTVGASGHFSEVAPDGRRFGNRTLIFNGSDFYRKGGDVVVAAFRLIRERFPESTLTIVGNTHLKPEAGIRLPGKITRSELFTLFDATDIVLAPSRYDCFPGFVLEAMSHGVVPILSDALAMSEIIDDGQEGYIVSPTPAEIAARVTSLFDDVNRLLALSTGAKARIRRDWNWDRVASKIAAALEQKAP